MEMLIAFVAFILFFLFMAIGYLVKGKPLKGSCGGVANLMGKESCDICGGDPNKCEENQKQESGKEEARKQKETLSYEATRKDR